MSTDTFESKDGLRLFSRSWLPPGTTRGNVVVVHGLKSHSGLYEWTAEQLNQVGLAVHAADLRGHGRSEGERYHVDKFDDYVSDLARFVAIVRAPEPRLPLFVLGHSAGGVIACFYALDHQKEMAGLICEDFAHEVPAPDVALAVLKGVSHVVPHAHLFNLKEEDFSRDPMFVARMKSDPLINHGPGTVQILAEIVRADERLKKAFGRITVPVLILHGTADKVAKPSGSKRFYEQTGSTDKTLKLYDGYFHDPLNDVGKEKVMADIIAWLGAHVPG